MQMTPNGQIKKEAIVLSVASSKTFTDILLICIQLYVFMRISTEH